jgi:hypothetical protein
MCHMKDEGIFYSFSYYIIWNNKWNISKQLSGYFK